LSAVYFQLIIYYTILYYNIIVDKEILRESTYKRNPIYYY
jgi:hypothetical protein